MNHPAELRSVIADLTDGRQRSGTALSGLANKNEVGIAGQSDGGDVSLATADNTCCYDSTVKAVAVLSGAELSSFGGTYFVGLEVPLLVAQGTADTVNLPGCSAQLYDEAKGPKWYVDLLGTGHLVPNQARRLPTTGPLALKDAVDPRVVRKSYDGFLRGRALRDIATEAGYNPSVDGSRRPLERRRSYVRFPRMLRLRPAIESRRGCINRPARPIFHHMAGAGTRPGRVIESPGPGLWRSHWS